MKVIVEGRLPSEHLCRGTCVHCRAQVEFKAGEARVSSDPRDGTLYIVKCPTSGCGRDIYGSRVERR